MALITREGKDSKGADIKVGAFTGDDLWSEIGASRDQITFARRTQALSDPAAYETARSAALAELKTAAAVTFKSTYDSYIAGGFGKAEAKNLATSAAKVNYDFGMKALRASFPSAADNVFQSAATSQGIHMARAASRTSKTKKKASKRR